MRSSPVGSAPAPATVRTDALTLVACSASRPAGLLESVGLAKDVGDAHAHGARADHPDCREWAFVRGWVPPKMVWSSVLLVTDRAGERPARRFH